MKGDERAHVPPRSAVRRRRKRTATAKGGSRLRGAAVTPVPTLVNGRPNSRVGPNISCSSARPRTERRVRGERAGGPYRRCGHPPARQLDTRVIRHGGGARYAPPPDTKPPPLCYGSCASAGSSFLIASPSSS